MPRPGGAVQGGYARTTETCVNEPALRLALREMQQVLARPGTAVILAAMILGLGFSGPFGTFDSLRFLPRILYWAAVILLTFTSGWVVARWVMLALMRRGAARVGQWLAASLAVSAVVAAEVGVLNALMFEQRPFDLPALGDLMLSTVPIAVLVTAALTWGYRRPAPSAAPAPAPGPALPAPPRLLARLPLDKRGALIALSVQDHYVEVVTTKGRELLLMRLSDAIAEADPCAGLQVHRSHWVALDKVRAARRDGARGVLTMADGREIPVSRSYLPDAKAAGLF